MKNTLALFTGLMTFPLALAGQSSLDLRAIPVHDSVLIEVLNGGEMRDLNKIGPATRKSLALRLYGVAHSGTCVEETEWVCSYRYVLAVSEYGEVPSKAVYDLGEVGEIANVRWLQPDSSDHSNRATLELQVRSAPGHASARNPKLKVQVRRYRLDISLDSLAIHVLR